LTGIVQSMQVWRRARLAQAFDVIETIILERRQGEQSIDAVGIDDGAMMIQTATAVAAASG
jgi:hypothetical protein